MGVGEEAVVANAMETVRQHVEQEAPHELADVEAHDLAGNHPPITVSTPTADVAVLLVHVGCRRGRYPIGSWSEHAEGRLCPGQASEDRRIMATCREQYKTMPDRVVKAQALPDMKERAERVKNASDREKP